MYDILEMDIGRKVDERQLPRSAVAVSALVDREIERGIDSRRVVVAGFSRGGAGGRTWPRAQLSAAAGGIARPAVRRTSRPRARSRCTAPTGPCRSRSVTAVSTRWCWRNSATRRTRRRSPWATQPGTSLYPIGHNVSPEEIVVDVSRAGCGRR
ncbi:MAG: alpha/beta hydrolase [Comamonadaceae bacterium]|nr:alpha/beta hydrolase [Comamonadaceae bacterium]